jgi:hypothetical protein
MQFLSSVTLGSGGAGHLRIPDHHRFETTEKLHMAGNAIVDAVTSSRSFLLVLRAFPCTNTSNAAGPNKAGIHGQFSRNGLDQHHLLAFFNSRLGPYNYGDICEHPMSNHEQDSQTILATMGVPLIVETGHLGDPVRDRAAHCHPRPVDLPISPPRPYLSPPAGFRWPSEALSNFLNLHPACRHQLDIGAGHLAPVTWRSYIVDVLLPEYQYKSTKRGFTTFYWTQASNYEQLSLFSWFVYDERRQRDRLAPLEVILASLGIRPQEIQETLAAYRRERPCTDPPNCGYVLPWTTDDPGMICNHCWALYVSFGQAINVTCWEEVIVHYFRCLAAGKYHTVPHSERLQPNEHLAGHVSPVHGCIDGCPEVRGTRKRRSI